MAEFEVSGSKNGFEFGPVTIAIDGLDGDDAGAAILDEVLAREDVEGIDTILHESQRGSHNARDQAVRRGFTSLLYVRKDGVDRGERIRIL